MTARRALGVPSVFEPDASDRSVPVHPFVIETVEQGLTPLAHLGVKTEAPTDDRPYFFHVASPFANAAAHYDELERRTGLALNLGPTTTLRHTVTIVAVLSVLLLLVLPGWIREKAAGTPPAAFIRGTFSSSGR